MPEKDPTNYGWITYAWVMIVAAAGGAVNFHRKMREGAVRALNFTEFIGELITSAFAGVITFWLCEWQGVPPLLSAVFIAISGHMGSRAIFGIEKWAEGRFIK
jgi:hypothetical protein